MRTLVETKVLAGDARALPPRPRGARRVQVPATVQAVLAARIDRLPAESKRLLQAAAVIGKDVSLRAAAGRSPTCPRRRLRRNLTLLQSGEFLYEISLFPSVEYTFTPRADPRGGLLRASCRSGGARCTVASWQAIEQLYADRLAEHVERLAHHALRGEVWDKAVAYLRQAGAKAAARSANREAVMLLRAGAGGARSTCPRAGQTTEQAIDLRLDLRPPLLQLGQLERVLDALAGSGGAWPRSSATSSGWRACTPT